MRPLRIVAYVAAGLIGLIVIGLVLVVVFVDPNDYRDDIEQLVEEKTGRELTLSGDLKLSVFPWIALETGPAALGDAPGFGDEPFVSIQDARVGVRLLPLLRGKVEVGNVRLDGARIRLITDENGSQQLGGSRRERSRGDAAPTRERTDRGADDRRPRDQRRGGRRWRTGRRRRRRDVRDFNLKTGRLASGEPFDFTTDFVLDQDPSLSAKVQVAATVTADLERNVHRLAEPKIDVNVSGAGLSRRRRSGRSPREVARSGYRRRSCTRLDGLTLKTTWKGDGLPAAGVPVAFSAQGSATRISRRRRWSSPDWMPTLAGAHLTGSLTGAEILDAPKLHGLAQARSAVAARMAAEARHRAAADHAIRTCCKQLSFASNVALTKILGRGRRHRAAARRHDCEGMLGVADFAAKALRFDLNVDRINADRYLPPPVEKPAAKDGEGAADRDSGRNAAQAECARPAVGRRGDLRRHQVHEAAPRRERARRQGALPSVGGIDVRRPVSRRHRHRLRPATSRASRSTSTSAASTSRRCSRICSRPSASPARAAPTSSSPAAGRTTDDVMKTLDGTVDFKVADGALEGADLWYEIRRARAVLKQQAIPERPSGPPRTPFSCADRHRRDERRRADEQRPERRDAVPEGDGAGQRSICRRTRSTIAWSPPC